MTLYVVTEPTPPTLCPRIETAPFESHLAWGASGFAYQLTDAKGRLRANGRLDIRVRGLVLVTTGANPQANFRAIVSCLTTDASGAAAATSNVVTEQFPATPEGDSEIDAVVDLPTPCIAPIVFVTNGAGTAWFAATGR